MRKIARMMELNNSIIENLTEYIEETTPQHPILVLIDFGEEITRKYFEHRGEANMHLERIDPERNLAYAVHDLTNHLD